MSVALQRLEFMSRCPDNVMTSLQAIKHLASPNHVENVNTFWIEHGGDFDKQRLYVIEASDLASVRCSELLYKNMLQCTP